MDVPIAADTVILLPSFAHELSAVVFGASGAIGSAFVSALAGDERVSCVYAGAPIEF